MAPPQPTTRPQTDQPMTTQISDGSTAANRSSLRAGSMMCLGGLVLLLANAGRLSAQSTAAGALNWRVHQLRADSEFSACAVFDVDRDGRPDVFSGDSWYSFDPAHPDRSQRHRVREVEQIRGRFDDYSNLPADVDGDGWTDVISVNYRSKSLYWVRNPGRNKIDWSRHAIAVPGSSETGRLVDVNDDGRLDILPNGTTFAAWWEFEPASQPGKEPEFRRHDLPAQLAGHGIGAGDIDGDGRTDLVNPAGWFRSTPSESGIRWIWHPEFELHRDAGLPILVADVDRDGDADIIWGRGHNVGVYWLEQRPDADNDERQWVPHAIDTSWSCCHSLLMGDIDGDGFDELVTGKRFQGHDGRDPGENDPLQIVTYDFDPRRRVWHRQVVHSGGNVGMDLDPKLADIDGDGDLDIACPARCGLSWCENLGPVRNSARPEQDLRISGSTAHTHRPDRNLKEFVADPTTGRVQPIKTKLDWGQRRAEILDSIQLVTGPLPDSSARIPLDVRIIESVNELKYVRRRLSYQAHDGWARVEASLLIPHELSKPTPAILCLARTTHPDDTNPDDTNPVTNKADTEQGQQAAQQTQPVSAHELAERGYVCLVVSPVAAGSQDSRTQAESKVSGLMRNVWNQVRAIDLLESLPEVDRDRIGCLGHGMRAQSGLFTAAFDLRLRVVVSSSGFTGFRYYRQGELSDWSQPALTPRIGKSIPAEADQIPFDFPELLAAAAPRGVVLVAPRQHKQLGVRGAQEAEQAARPIYRLFDAEESLVTLYPPGGEDFPLEIRYQCYDAIDRWFKFSR